MTDQMVLKTQQWLNATFGNKTGFGSVEETGNTGWDTINALIRALQIELGITATANNFGTGTQTRFTNRWPDGIKQTNDESNVESSRAPCGARDTGPSTAALLFSSPTTWQTRLLPSNPTLESVAPVPRSTSS